MRIASFKQAGKRQHQGPGRQGESAAEDIALEGSAFIASVQRPAAQNSIKALVERGFHRPGDVENRLGFYVAQLG